MHYCLNYAKNYSGQLFNEITEPFLQWNYICSAVFKDLCLQFNPMCLELRAKDSLGESESMERQTNTMFLKHFKTKDHLPNEKNSQTT